MSILAKVTKGNPNAPRRVYVYGPPGIGKTTFAASAPAALILALEDGAKRLEVAQVEVDTADAFDAAIEEIRASKLRGELPYQTIVIDTVDALEAKLRDRVSALAGAPFAAIPFGRGPEGLLDEWRRILARLDELVRVGLSVVLLGHSTTREMTPPDQPSFSRYEPALYASEKKSTWGRIVAWCDFVFLARWETVVTKRDGRTAGVSTGARYLLTTWSAAWEAKHRGALPERLPLDWQAFDEADRGGSSDVAALRAELEALLPSIVDPKLRARAERDAANASPRDLARIVNTIRAKQPQPQKETDQ